MCVCVCGGSVLVSSSRSWQSRLTFELSFSHGGSKCDREGVWGFYESHCRLVWLTILALVVAAVGRVEEDVLVVEASVFVDSHGQ